jgi:hypothetical protein
MSEFSASAGDAGLEQIHEFSSVSNVEVVDNGHEGRRVSSTPRLCQENERGY